VNPINLFANPINHDSSGHNTLNWSLKKLEVRPARHVKKLISKKSARRNTERPYQSKTHDLQVSVLHKARVYFVKDEENARQCASANIR
jgi:hypothetical protein